MSPCKCADLPETNLVKMSINSLPPRQPADNFGKWSGSKTVWHSDGSHEVLYKKCDFEKNKQTTKKHEKLPSGAKSLGSDQYLDL